MRNLHALLACLHDISAPIGIVPVLLLYFVWPKDNHSTNVAAKAKLQHLDFLGATLMISGSVLLVIALQQAGSRTWTWNSGTSIVLLTLSASSWAALFVWEWFVFSHPRFRKVHPQFPYALLQNRVMASTIL